MKQKEIQKGEIVIYKSKEGPNLKVRLEDETTLMSLFPLAIGLNLFVEPSSASGLLKPLKSISSRAIPSMRHGSYKLRISCRNYKALSLFYRINPNTNF